MEEWIHGTADSRRIMQFAHREMLSLHMILVMVTTAGAVVAIFGLIGPIGTDEAMPPLQRWAYYALYFFPGWPICYSLNVVVLYFVRSRSPLEVVLALALAGLFGAVPCTTVMYTFETLIQAHRSATAELLRLFVVVATVAVASNVLFLYVVYQRLKQERGNIGGPAASDGARYARSRRRCRGRGGRGGRGSTA